MPSVDVHHADESVTLWHGDCLDVLRELADCSVDSIVTDPPYGLGFMGKEWDDLPPGVEWAAECLRVLKPGGHLLAFGGSRTWHRLAVAVEDAGFEIRDSIAWLYGSGFPKSLDVSKAIDKQRQDDPAWRVVGQWLKGYREEAGYRTRADLAPLILTGHKNLESAAANLSNWENGLSFPTWDRWLSLKEILSLPDDVDAEVWRLNGRKGKPGEAWDQREVIGQGSSGIGTAFGDGQWAQGAAQTFDITAPATPAAEQWQGWGTALKPAFEPVVVGRKPLVGTVAANVLAHGTGALNIDGCRIAATDKAKFPEGYAKMGRAAYAQDDYTKAMTSTEDRNPSGRWPANVVLDESQAAALDEQSGTLHAPGTSGGKKRSAVYGLGMEAVPQAPSYSDTGGASRFFYVAKAPKSERPRTDDGTSHPTVKPIALMRWLVRLVTPPGGVVLEPFAGSGTTVEACLLEGFQCIAIEREADYLPLIEARIARVSARPVAPDLPSLFDLDGVGA